MPRFPPHQFHGPNYRPRHPNGNGQFINRSRGFPGPQHFQNFHPEGARFHGPHGRGIPPEQFFQRGPRQPYRGGMAGRPDGFPMSAHGHGPPHSQFSGAGFGHQNAFDINQASEEQFAPQMFHSPTNKPNVQNVRNGVNSNFKLNRKPGGGARGNFFGQQRDWKKKNKKAKAPKEINYSHYCDVCDRGFQSDEQLKSHIAEHVKCKEKDCRFVGHPKVVKMHHKLHHGPGSKKIRWLDTPEEIQKWRNERKRNFPTAENIAKKGLKIEQKEKQGNVLETKQFGKMKRTHRGKRGQGRFRRKKLAQANASVMGNQEVAESINSDHVPPKRSKTDDDHDQSSPAAKEQGAEASDPVQPTQGIESDHSIPSSSHRHPTGAGQQGPVRDDDCDPLSLLASHDNDSGDEDAGGAQGVTPEVEVAPNGTFGALGSLAACYDSESEESLVGETDDATKMKRAQGVIAQDESLERCLAAGESTNLKNFSDLGRGVQPQDADVTCCHSNEMSEERVMNVGDEGQERSKRFNRKDGRKRKRAPDARGKGAGNQLENKKKATLLEMLLAPEIRKERNIILQCVRHIVKNNFFQDDGH